MQFTFAKCLAASIAALVLPSVAAQTNTSQEFFLRTEVIDGNPKFANLYPIQFHTQAATNDITLQASKEGSLKSFLDGTRLMGDLTGSGSSWGWQITFVDYTGWLPANLNIGEGFEGFEVQSENGLVWQSSESQGWIACDWAHGKPQLFWLNTIIFESSFYNLTTPSICAKVKLVQEFI